MRETLNGKDKDLFSKQNNRIKLMYWIKKVDKKKRIKKGLVKYANKKYTLQKCTQDISWKVNSNNFIVF